MDQGQPRVIIWTTLVVLPYTMLHTKFQGHWSIGSGEEDFLRFLPYMGMAAMLVMWPAPFEQLFVPPSPGGYRIYPKYSDTLNVRTPSFFLQIHLFYVPYISGHVPYRVFLLSLNVRTPKTCPLFLIKLLFFTTRIFCIFALFTCVSG